jgi:hypothetical protein
MIVIRALADDIEKIVDFSGSLEASGIHDGGISF